MNVVEYRGWKNNLRLSNGDAELIVTLDVGPRIISYRLADGRNVFHEAADQLGKSGEAEWVGRGGHRLFLVPAEAAIRIRILQLDSSARPDSQAVGNVASRHGFLAHRGTCCVMQ